MTRIEAGSLTLALIAAQLRHDDAGTDVLLAGLDRDDARELVRLLVTELAGIVGAAAEVHGVELPALLAIVQRHAVRLARDGGA